MRKTLIFSFGLAATLLATSCTKLAATLLATSCTKEENFNQTQGIVFSSSISSRATDTSFEGNDEIGISMTPGNTTNVLYSTEDGTNFTSANPITYGMAGNVETVDFTAVYPYKEGSISNGAYSFTLSTDAETPLTENDVMLATATEISVGSKNVNLNFKHKLVKVVVQLSDANGQAITGAQLKINNQQLTGSLNLSDATVTSTDAADDEMPFAANASISGQYQTIVMPSAPVQGRYIEVIHEGKTYTLPVDNQEFVSGKKLTFTATLNADGTVDPGKPITVIPSVSDWDEEKVESGWILTGEISVVGKNAKQLASNIQLNSSQAVVINNFTGTLTEDDIYSISYTRADGSTLSTDITTANITIAPAAGGAGKTYTLPAGQSEGKLLIKVGNNTSGISITTTDSGITLSDITVYTSSNDIATTDSGITLSDITVYTSSNDIAIPITLWEGTGYSDNYYWATGIANFNIAPDELKLGSKLRIYCNAKPKPEDGTRIYFSTYTNDTYGENEMIIYDGYNYIENNEEEGYITVLVLDQLIKDITKNNFIVGLKGANCDITKIVLIPASENETVSENLLWKGNGAPMMYGSYVSIDLWLQKEIEEGGKIRVSFTNTGISESPITLSCYETNDKTTSIMSEKITSEMSSVEFTIDNTIYSKLQNIITNKQYISFLINEGNSIGPVITSIEYIPVQ